jgi:hypothetical protein
MHLLNVGTFNMLLPHNIPHETIFTEQSCAIIDVQSVKGRRHLFLSREKVLQRRFVPF